MLLNVTLCISCCPRFTSDPDMKEAIMQLVACTGQGGSSDSGSLCQMPWQQSQAFLSGKWLVCVCVDVCVLMCVCVDVCVCRCVCVHRYAGRKRDL